VKPVLTGLFCALVLVLPCLPGLTEGPGFRPADVRDRVTGLQDGDQNVRHPTGPQRHLSFFTNVFNWVTYVMATNAAAKFTPGFGMLVEKQWRFFSAGFMASHFMVADVCHYHPDVVAWHEQFGLLLRFIIPFSRNIQLSLGHLIGWNWAVVMTAPAFGTGYSSRTMLGFRAFWSDWGILLDAGAYLDFLWGMHGDTEVIVGLIQVNAGVVRRF